MSDNEPKDETSGCDELPEDPETPIDFATFVLSLSSSAAYHLGFAPHPEDGTFRKNFPMARQTIDILCILKDKTKGNLSESEEQLLSEILYNLRMAFVRESGHGPA